MVVSDINLVCVDQKQKSYFHIPDAEFLYFNRNNDNNDVIYSNRYEFLNKTTGIWYQIYPKRRDIGDYTHEFLDMYIDYNSDKRIVFIDNNIKLAIIDIIKYLLEKSPKKEILFFADLQGYSDSIERISYNVFIKMYNEEKLLFNKVYAISNQGTVL